MLFFLTERGLVDVFFFFLGGHSFLEAEGDVWKRGNPLGGSRDIHWDLDVRGRFGPDMRHRFQTKKILSCGIWSQCGDTRHCHLGILVVGDLHLFHISHGI